MTETTARNTKPDKCPHCGIIHATTCPRIKAIEYADNGTVRRIEFHPHGAGETSLFESVFGRKG